MTTARPFGPQPEPCPPQRPGGPGRETMVAAPSFKPAFKQPSSPRHRNQAAALQLICPNVFPDPSQAPPPRLRAHAPPGPRKPPGTLPIRPSRCSSSRARASASRSAPCPANFQLSIDELVKECDRAHALGIGGVILFGIPDAKDESASGAYAEDGIVQQALRAVRRTLPKLLLITDVCNCEYTSHGHCGKIVANGDVDNDSTLEWLAGCRRIARARRSRHRRALRHDGRPRRRDSDGARQTTAFRTLPSWPTPPSSPRPFTAHFAKPPNPRRSSATAAPIRWTPPTAAKRCTKWSWISRRARTC